MFYIRMVFRDLWRYKVKTCLYFVICIAAVLFLGIYVGNLEKSRQQLYDLAKNVPVEAVITNLSGGLEDGLFIKGELYDGVMNSKNVSDPKFTLQLMGVRGGEEFSVLAVNSWGMNDEFFETGDNVCLVTTDFLREQGLEVGDELKLKLKYYEIDTKTHYSYNILPLEKVSYKIAGVTGEDAPAQIMVPMETARNSYRNQGIKFHVSSGRFYVKNPLKLNSLKREMEKIGFLELIAQAQMAYEGYALVIRDETFIRAAESVQEGYMVQKALFPVVCVVLVGAGFVTSYLLSTGRRQEYATMRLTGMPYSDCLAVYLTEQGMIQLMGGAIGSVLAVFAAGTGSRPAIICYGAFFLFFFAGSVVALWMFRRMSIVNMLTSAD